MKYGPHAAVKSLAAELNAMRTPDQIREWLNSRAYKGSLALPHVHNCVIAKVFQAIDGVDWALAGGGEFCYCVGDDHVIYDIRASHTVEEFMARFDEGEYMELVDESS